MWKAKILFQFWRRSPDLCLFVTLLSADLYSIAQWLRTNVDACTKANIP